MSARASAAPRAAHHPRGLTLAFAFAAGLLLAFIVLPLANLYGAQSEASLARVAAMAEVRSAILLSLGAALATTACAALLGVPLAYLLARTSFPGKPVVEAIVDLPLAVPHTVVGIALLFVFGRTGIVGAPLEQWTGLKFWGTAAGVVIAMLYVSVPYAVNAARVGLEGVDERLEKVARTLGAGRWAVFFRVTLPLGARGILTGLALTFARSVSEFGAVIVLTYYPMTAPVKIYDLFLQSGLGDSSAMSALYLAITLSLFIASRYLFRERREPESMPAR
ncbi:MAG TPA: ABC transporter permease [Usitatibacter sp.]|nr:ABC transporter permease [Usitatibacter sp.]